MCAISAIVGVYWPSAFENLDKQLASQDEYVVVSETWEQLLNRGICARILTCGLIDEKAYGEITAEHELGCKVSSSGPHPCVSPDTEYVPHFWIHGGPAIPENIEPLVQSWQSNNRTVHWPDAGFLMTYGLTPRIAQQDQTIHWDDPADPAHDIVIVDPVSIYEPMHKQSVGCVRIRRDFLQDYASLRQKAVVCVFYERWLFAQDEESEDQLGDDKYKEWRKLGAYYRLQRIVGTTDKYCLDIWGHRLMMQPGEYPVSEGANDYGELLWPGVSDGVTGQNYGRFVLDSVYVRDDVLGRFEGRDEYSIHPESGSVRFGGQWGVGFCDRYGRDLIRLELRKLYEGNWPYIVRHYHQHAVEAPEGDPQTLLKAPNVGRRAKRIVYAFVSLGEALADLCGQILNEDFTSEGTVGMRRADLDYNGWWKAEYVEPICRHAPISMTQDGFVSRCKNLDKLVIAGLKLSARFMKANYLRHGGARASCPLERRLVGLAVLPRKPAPRPGHRLWSAASSWLHECAKELPPDRDPHEEDQRPKGNVLPGVT